MWRLHGWPGPCSSASWWKGFSPPVLLHVRFVVFHVGLFSFLRISVVFEFQGVFREMKYYITVLRLFRSDV